MGNKTKQNALEEMEHKPAIVKELYPDNKSPKVEKLSRVERIERIAIRSESFSGPIPHPKILQGYDSVCPGAADRIIKMSEDQMAHRHTMEKTFLNAHSRNSLLGIIAAFFLGLVVTIGGIICILNDKQTAGTILGGTGLGTVIFAFINGTKMSVNGNLKNENKDNQEPKEE